MNEYRAMLRKLAELESDEVVASKTPSHACMIIAELLTRANRTADMVIQRPYVGMFDSDVESAACAFLKRTSTKIRLIVPKGLVHNSLTDFREATLCYGSLDEDKFEVLECSIPKLLQIQFVCVDSKAFWFENDMNSSALACFNRPSTAVSLTNVFESLKGQQSSVRESA